jgi:ubiquinone/menaquinone biosynthesis C-methylase UbiE
MSENDADVIERERRFHNARFAQNVDPRAPLDKWYAAVRHGAELQNEMVRGLARGKDVLEYGCADGGLSMLGLRLPEICASLTGIDISDVAIAKAVTQAAQLGYGNTSFKAMNAEAMTFPDASFDVVYGRGIVHHLDLRKCFGEVSRVLRKDGAAVFSEPMGHNPLLNFYRKRTPELRTEDEHPLRMSDFALARQYFARVDILFYGLFTAASVLIDPAANGKAYRMAKAVDDFLLRLPFVGRYAWHCLMICRKAGKDA